MNNTLENNAVPLRARLKQLRAEINPIDRHRGALLIRGRLFTWLATTRARLLAANRPAPQHIAAFWSMDEEPELQPLLHQWVEENGLTVSLPVVADIDAPLEFRVWTPDTEMQIGAYGIAEPQSELAPLPDLVLVPTLGYTRAGDRIGYGKGYYDRTLAAIKTQQHSCTTIGIAWSCGDLSSQAYTPAGHDVRLDAVLTDKGWAVPAPVLL
ncbi:5-formyltetrahydrofolate cyclo-ligase [Paralcaligenes ureilyticus]|uniref:5-formyltetrahydrofolate cyclo-ligase n=1 Tax=Paralcaligenes ureilyticus TaxID=627131 RepID=A0A4R3M2G2_9BURK|nr:5-formyltetrahydrofolate cyclo-ligase [Paralcaligenes ureilyticus]TCT07310.1 5,10-methenyltetrahydrofolate synthetase [Paralcaligenes ureilyticus]